jgi:DNA-binding response OmpR family regulator
MGSANTANHKRNRDSVLQHLRKTSNMRAFHVRGEQAPEFLASEARVPRILVIEDDPQQREIYTKLLHYNGFDVEFAEDGETGLVAAHAMRPDAILVDLVLPGMNGLSVVSFLREAADTAQIPIITMSAYDMDAHRVRSAGANEFLRKPVAGDVLVRAIRRYIGSNDIPDTAAPSLS